MDWWKNNKLTRNLREKPFKRKGKNYGVGREGSMKIHYKIIIVTRREVQSAQETNPFNEYKLGYL